MGSRRQAMFAMSFLVAALVAPAAQARSPQQVLNALLAAKVGAGALPHGYRSPHVSVYTVTATAEKHHALGGAEITADGGNEAIIYIVFETKADAVADFQHANLAGKRTSKAPSSIPKPAVVVSTSVSGTANGKKVTLGITDIAFVQGNVLVQAATTSTSSKTHGDVAGAIALAHFASTHLTSIQR